MTNKNNVLLVLSKLIVVTYSKFKEKYISQILKVVFLLWNIIFKKWHIFNEHIYFMGDVRYGYGVIEYFSVFWHWTKKFAKSSEICPFYEVIVITIMSHEKKYNFFQYVFPKYFLKFEYVTGFHSKSTC